MNEKATQTDKYTELDLWINEQERKTDEITKEMESDAIVARSLRLDACTWAKSW